MPRIFDNISQQLLTTLRATLVTASHADFCVGYFNLRGWKALDDLIEAWDPSQGQMCRVLIGMQRPPQDEVKELYQIRQDANNPITGFVGSSNLTMSGLSRQGELNVDVLDHDAEADADD